MKTCYTCIFSNYEELKDPAVITPGWKYVCYTDQKITSNVWEIIKVDLGGHDPQRMSRYYKIMEWVDWERSIWVDASFIINTDLNLWWETYFQKGFSAPKHPLRNCVYIEAFDCIIAKRGNKEQVQAQMEEYKQLKIPANNGIIQSGILMRENSDQVIKLCESWYRELVTHSVRDQIAFAKVSIPFAEIIHTYQFDYRRSKDFQYHFHYNRRGGSHIKMSI